MLEGAEDLKATSMIETKDKGEILTETREKGQHGCCEQRLSMRVSTPGVYVEHWEAREGVSRGVLTSVSKPLWLMETVRWGQEGAWAEQ